MNEFKSHIIVSMCLKQMSKVYCVNVSPVRNHNTIHLRTFNNPVVCVIDAAERVYSKVLSMSVWFLFFSFHTCKPQRSLIYKVMGKRTRGACG